MTEDNRMSDQTPRMPNFWWSPTNHLYRGGDKRPCADAVRLVPESAEHQPTQDSETEWGRTVYRVLLTFYGGPEAATADQRDHVASMARAIVDQVQPPAHPDWLADDDHGSERAAHADNWEVTP